LIILSQPSVKCARRAPGRAFHLHIYFPCYSHLLSVPSWQAVIMAKCTHSTLQLDVSPHAAEAGFTRPHARVRAAAATLSGDVPNNVLNAGGGNVKAGTFPGPLVLPRDDLALDPEWPPQSVKEWLEEPERNKLTQRKKTIYVIPPPETAPGVDFIKSWAEPLLSPAEKRRVGANGPIRPPRTEDVRAYLEAFYHGMPVKILPKPLHFVKWEDQLSKNTTPEYIGLQYGDSVTRIRTRSCPDGVFGRQLNLSDILDAELEMIPKDSYSIVMVVKQDLYEDEDDDFCCGRAYGGSRIAVVSTARYNPVMDGHCNVDREHMWPASHCQAYFDEMCKGEKPAKRRKVASEKEKNSVSSKPTSSNKVMSPMAAAIEAADKAPAPSANLEGLWLSRVVRTVSHELGHCYGMDHCIYYACIMQGTASLVEDVRQPPYLCPVCLEKLVLGMKDILKPELAESAYLAKRDEALSKLCARWEQIGMFAAFGAWIEARKERT
jgi:archaemetzincin